jgi:hypothetical protein
MTTFKRIGFGNLEKNSPESEGASHRMHLKGSHQEGFCFYEGSKGGRSGF